MTVRFIGLKMALLAAFVVAGTGCANKMNAENDGLRSQNAELKQKADAQAAQIDALQKQVGMMTAQNTTPTTPDPMGTPGMEGAGGGAGGGPVDLSNGRPGVAPRPAGGTGRAPAAGAGGGAKAGASDVTIEISGDVLFDSGQIKLKPAAEKTLDAIVAQIKKSYPNHTLRIEGHTDPTPVKATAKGYSNNYELGLARANAVMQYLAKKGISEKLMSVKSFGSTNPRSATNLALDRRVDIIVVNAK